MSDLETGLKQAVAEAPQGVGGAIYPGNSRKAGMTAPEVI